MSTNRPEPEKADTQGRIFAIDDECGKYGDQIPVDDVLAAAVSPALKERTFRHLQEYEREVRQASVLYSGIDSGKLNEMIDICREFVLQLARIHEVYAESILAKWAPQVSLPENTDNISRLRAIYCAYCEQGSERGNRTDRCVAEIVTLAGLKTDLDNKRAELIKNGNEFLSEYLGDMRKKVSV